MSRLTLRIIVCTGLALASGCATQQGTADRSESWSEWVRMVDAFEVRDSSGVAYDQPFLGGLNLPRPQFVDIDADGDSDLFVQERPDAVKFFEQTGTPAEPKLTWRTDRYQNLSVGEWYRFADVDLDGDMDLLAEERFSYVRYYRNEGTPQQAHFVLAMDTLRDAAGSPLFADRQNILNVTDIDCDDLPDLFIGRVTGTVMRYESVGLDADRIPRFELITERFEDIEIIGQVMGSLHGANTLTFNDLDRDGDQDLFWGDYFEPGLLYIENTGTCEQPSLRGDPIPFPPEDPIATSGYNAPALTDWDGDDDLDLFVGVLGGAFNANRTTADNFYYFEQTSDGYTLHSTRFLSQIDVGSESIPAFADLDADGDPDLLLSNKIDQDDLQTGSLYFFENLGTPTRPVFQLRGELDLEPTFHYAPAPGDLDGDGDLDLLVGTWNKKMAYYRNEGTARSPRFVIVNEAYLELPRGSNTTPALVDIDTDGDLDLFVGETSGTINFFRNTGTPAAASFVLEAEDFDDIDVGRRSFPHFADIDQDEDYDMLIGSDTDGIHFYRNTGTPAVFNFVRDTTLTFPNVGLGTPFLIDIDGDGDPDFLSGTAEGGLMYYENRHGNR